MTGKQQLEDRMENLLWASFCCGKHQTISVSPSGSNSWVMHFRFELAQQTPSDLLDRAASTNGWANQTRSSQPMFWHKLNNSLLKNKLLW